MNPAVNPRQIAAQWHGGQASALYAFASTGTVLPGIEVEIKACWFAPSTTTPDRVGLAQLWVVVAGPVRLNNIQEARSFGLAP